MTSNFRFRVTHMRMTYSHHTTSEAAHRAAKALARKWGLHTHIGSEPRVEQLTETGWRDTHGEG